VSLWFVVPAHGRLALTAICLRQLRRTCDALTENGVEASAVVIACDENLGVARELGFATVPRPNDFPSQKFNDGIQLALDERFNPRPAEYVVPLGSDDWVDWRLFRRLPPADTMVGFQQISFVREDGREMSTAVLTNDGGSGIRIYSRAIMRYLAYRPADEDRPRGCDTSILVNLRRACTFKIEHRRLDPRQIVDWKSPGQQLNAYEMIRSRWRMRSPVDPFEALAGVYPDEALEEMAAHYARGPVAA
jgi:hypothetical protein